MIKINTIVRRESTRDTSRNRNSRDGRTVNYHVAHGITDGNRRYC